MMRTFFAILLVTAGAALQAALPVFAWLGGIRPEVLPALVAYFALSLKRPAAVVALAALAGLMHDSLSAAPFGVTVATFGAAAQVLWWLRDWLERGLPWVQLVAGAFVSLVTGIVALTLVGVTAVAVVKLVWLALLNAVVAVVVFFALDYGRMQMGWDA